MALLIDRGRMENKLIIVDHIIVPKQVIISDNCFQIKINKPIPLSSSRHKTNLNPIIISTKTYLQ